MNNNDKLECNLSETFSVIRISWIKRKIGTELLNPYFKRISLLGFSQNLFTKIINIETVYCLIIKYHQVIMK